MQQASGEAVFIVTDIEADGPTPGVNSMLSFASVAVTADGVERGAFEAVLAPPPGAVRDPDVWAWFQTQPEALAAATADPRPPEAVMADYVAWVSAFAAPRVFAAFPLAFDGGWIDHYLRRFTRHQLVAGLYVEERLFDGAGLCLKSFAAGVLGKPFLDCNPRTLPAEWFGGFEHTHRAIDDARGYGALLGVLMGRSAARA